MVSELGRRPIVTGNDGSFGDEFENDIGLLLREQRRQEPDDGEELDPCRSGSAPPTVAGSFSAVGDLFGQRCVRAFSEFPSNNNANGFSSEDYRSDPVYASYYYSQPHLNPRLPPPLLPREDWRVAHKLHGGSSVLGGIGDRRKASRQENCKSRAFTPPGFDSLNENEAHPDGGAAEWDSSGLIGLSGLGLGSKQKSLAEIFQNDLVHSTPISGCPRPASRCTFDETVDNFGLSHAELPCVNHEWPSTVALRSPLNVQGSPMAAPSAGQSSSYSYAAVLGASLSRGSTPDLQLVDGTPSPCLTPIGGGRAITLEKGGLNSPNTFNGVSSVTCKSADLAVAFSGMGISSNGVINGETQLPSQLEEDADIHQNYFFNLQDAQNHTKNSSYTDPTKVCSDFMVNHDSRLESRNPSLLTDRQLGRGYLHPPYQQGDGANPSLQNYGLSGYNRDPHLASIMASHTGTGNLLPLFGNVAAASTVAAPKINSASSEPWTLNKMGNQCAFQAPFVDPIYLQYTRTSEYGTQQGGALHDPSAERSHLGNSYVDLLGLQKPYLGSLPLPQNSQYSVSKSGGSNHRGFYGSPYGAGMSYPASPLASPIIPNSLAGIGGNPIRPNEYNMCLHSGIRNIGPWQMDGGCNLDEGFASSLLEEFKSNKIKCFELCEIAGHVVEFSADQYGSRFIQQKLETATMEEKDMVFQEIMPHALSLMTDVFGNYVIQKFFEHGSASQIRELANKLNGHVLTLSLQMYGCRVIQKAIEVVDVDQKISMVEELDGHVMRCVRDQNGNHVIQKCIECVPEEAIQFIVMTFFDHVVTLSTHPYGCRVIQRILEHCKDPKTQSKVMYEILGSVSMLAKDQYGNYVVQHVLEHGKLHERSAIIEELAGKIVQMSQQKFASNVVEKCLTFGGPSEREILVNEMLGSTDENEPLQAMMKDQFANYVVQKVLETCNDQQRELILSRIKVHLNALKKYTYGKHIVARVEKLVAAGERRIAVQSPSPA